MNDILAMSNLEAGLFVFVMGLLVVFFGITVIVLVISLIGSIMKRKKKTPTKAEDNSASANVAPVLCGDEDDEKIRAAIVAVIAAYYFDRGDNCQFRIKKIKRI